MLETISSTKKAKKEISALIDPKITKIIALITNPQNPSWLLVRLRLEVRLTEFVTAT